LTGAGRKEPNWVQHAALLTKIRRQPRRVDDPQAA
jgi:hypothetical protein